MDGCSVQIICDCSLKELSCRKLELSHQTILRRSRFASSWSCSTPGKNTNDQNRVVFVLAGMGGVGKSEIILQFLQRHEIQIRERFWGFFWVDCEAETSATYGFNEIATLCGWPKDTKNGAQGVRARLSSHSKQILLILDDCDDKSLDYGRYISHGTQVTVIMAIRLRNSNKYATVDAAKQKDFCRVEGLNEADATELVFEILEDNEERSDTTVSAAKEMVAVIDFHSLAITVASSLIQAGIASLLTYAADYRRGLHQRNFLRAEESGALYKRISETFEISARALQNQALRETSHQDALHLVDLLAFLDRTSIPEEPFTRAWEFERTILQDGDNYSNAYLTSQHIKDSRTFLGDPLGNSNEQVLSFQEDDRLNRFCQARALLCQLTLIPLDPTSKAISMHSLVHTWARHRLPNIQPAWDATASCLAFSAQGPYWSPFSMHFQKHIESIWRYDVNKSTKNASLHRCTLYYILTWQSRHSECLNSHELSSILLEETRSLFSKDSEQAAEITYLNALCNNELPGQVSIENWQEAVQACNRAYGFDSIVSLPPRGHLAEAYAQAGHMSDAISVLELVAQRYSDLVEEEHGDQLFSQRLLARMYMDDEQLTKGIKLLESLVALEARRAAKDSQGRLLETMADLAEGFSRNGQALEAIRLGRDVVEMSVKGLGDTHPSTLYYRERLARAYLDNYQVSKAIELLEAAVKTGMCSLGEQRSSVGAVTLKPCQEDLGLAYLRSDRVEDSIHQFDKIARRHQNTLAEGSPERLYSETNLGQAYLIGRRFEDAIRLLEHVVQVSGTTLTEESFDRLASAHYSGKAYLRSGRFDDAIRLLEHVVEVEGTTLVEENSTRLSSQHNLATAYLHGERIEDGIRLLEHVLRIREVVLPQEDHGRLSTEFTLGLSYLQIEWVKDCIRLLGHVVKICSKIGPKDFQTLVAAKEVLLQAYKTDQRNTEEAVQRLRI